MHKILVPVDFSEASVAACRYALALMHQGASEVMLIHCFTDLLVSAPGPPLTGVDPSQRISEEILHGNEENTRHMLADLENNLAKTAIKAGYSGRIRSTFLWGPPHHQILDFSTQYVPDIIIMGKRGAGGLGEAIFGSVTSKIISDARFPVLTMPTGENWTRPENVLYCTDFTSFDREAMTKLVSIFKESSVSIHCVHLSSVHDESAGHKMQQLQNTVKNAGIEKNITFQVIHEKNFEEGIDNYASRQDIHLLAVLTHQRNFLERLTNPSMTKKLMRKIDLPILIFHDN